MSQSKVAGTVMLNLNNGEKKFLVKHDKTDHLDFIVANIDSIHTSLACILRDLKDVVKLDTSKMDLFELTNVTINSVSMPLFVFTLDENNVSEIDSATYGWENPKQVKNVLENIDISGVPFFY
ncbi:hypothetical protein ACWOAH_11445 [Vagococcus vulneris]|uniref:Uncharacterized protein n=1 Tax=Vagococcus vulneris TaxID=1977869 RepID=A0A429ZNX7_9ENTE|nr:hypothetical protein [Vagococcus vulneris]RST95391.1 hypothetical protein CBF37_11485 [Vagococcus vulneris]